MFYFWRVREKMAKKYAGPPANFQPVKAQGRFDDAGLCAEWLDFCRYNRGFSPLTVAKYRRYLERLREWLDGKHLAELGADDLLAWCGLQLHHEGITARSRRPAVSCVRMFYRWMKAHGHIDADLAKDIPYPDQGDALPVVMGLANFEKLLLQPDLGAFLGVRDSAILHLLGGTGARVSGICALNEDDLTWEREDGQPLGRLVVRLTEKGKKTRWVPVPMEAALIVRAYLGHPDLGKIDRNVGKGARVLFVTEGRLDIPAHEYRGEERRIRPRAVHEIVQKYGRMAGLPRAQCHPHALRHLYGTELAESDVDIRVIQSLMGHARVSTTEIYIQTARRHLSRAVDYGNPLAKIRSPMTEVARKMQAAKAHAGKG